MLQVRGLTKDSLKNQIEENLLMQKTREEFAKNINRPTRKDPFSDVESPSIIETEAFSPVTDKMVEKVMREERRKERAAALQERRMRKPAKRQDGESPGWIDPKKIRKKNDQGDGQ